MKYLLLFFMLLFGCQSETQQEYTLRQRRELLAQTTWVEAVVIGKYHNDFTYGAGGNHSVSSYYYYNIDYVDQSDLQIYSCSISGKEMTAHEYARIQNGSFYKLRVIKKDNCNSLIQWESK